MLARRASVGATLGVPPSRRVRCINPVSGESVIYLLLANAVLVLHLAFIVFVVAGGLFLLRWPRLLWWHLPALVWGVFIELSGGICPLTPLENALLRLGGEAGYSGGFVEHYLLPIIYPPNLTREWQWALGLGLLVFNLFVYARWWRCRSR